MQEQMLRRFRVLVADDVTIMQRLAERILQREYDVAIASDGEECLGRAASFCPDLILLDLNMPKLDGLRVLERLRANEETREVKVILCTTKGFGTELKQARELGVNGFISKPYQPAALKEEVARLLTGSGTGPAGEPLTETSGHPAVEEYLPAVRKESGYFRLWGTRGSVPTSGARFVRHGGNTSCMEVQCGEERVILDAGTGIRDLGLSLLPAGPCELHLFITHTHWDHIQGIPFFPPAFLPGYRIIVHAAPNLEKDLESIFCGQLDRAYFPVQMEDMQARFEFRTLGDEPIRIGDLEISWHYSTHPGPTVAYKINSAGKTLTWVPDNEFLKGYVGDPAKAHADSDLVAPYSGFVDFVSGVDVFVHEAQYPNDEYRTKVGWGHASLSNACVLAKLADAKRWIITHHDPAHDDDFLQEKLNLTRQILQDLDHPIDFCHGWDGMAGCM